MSSNMTFDEFAVSLLSHHWVCERKGKLRLDIYMRRGVKPYHAFDFCIANIHASEYGKGLLTAFLDKYEKLYRFEFENVVNVRLRDYLIRRGYYEYKDGDCMIGPAKEGEETGRPHDIGPMTAP